MIANLSFQNGIAIITLNRPEAYNALNAELIETLGQLFDEVDQSDAVALVLVGAGGKAFCAGADIKGLLGKSAVEQVAFSRLGQQVFAKLDALAIPSIAVLSGVAFGGGLELAMACTFRVATPAARLGLPEIKLGLIPAYGDTQRLSRLAGIPRALELVSTGRTLDAEESEKIGLVTAIRAADDPIAIGLDFAASLGVPFPASFRMASNAVLQGFDLPLQEALELEAHLFAEATLTSDATEGVSAFLEKRKPAFTG